MYIFEFRKIGKYLGTRMLGAKAREELLPVIQANDKVVLDFNGVSVVSNSFADECLGKLLHIYTLEELKERTTFRGLDSFAKKNVAIAFRRRLTIKDKEDKL